MSMMLMSPTQAIARFIADLPHRGPRTKASVLRETRTCQHSTGEVRPNAPFLIDRAELLCVLTLPDFERADRIGEFWGYPERRAFAELLIDR
jgi:hypothetical protein